MIKHARSSSCATEFICVSALLDPIAKTDFSPFVSFKPQVTVVVVGYDDAIGMCSQS